MANLRQYRARLRAVRNIRTIAKTLEMASAAKLRRIQTLTERTAPAAAAVDGILSRLVAKAGPGHPFLTAGEGDVAGLIVLAADRGMCGGYNQHIVSATIDAAESLIAAGRRVRLWVIGTKGADLLKRRLSTGPDAERLPEEALAPPHAMGAGFCDRRFEAESAALAEDLCIEFAGGWLAEVRLVYMLRFSPGSSEPATVQILPVPVGPAPSAEAGDAELYGEVDEIFGTLLPMVVRSRMLGCFLAGSRSEQAARLLAMRAATDNADDMIRDLFHRLNRLRQGRITAELAEIIGGMRTLKGGAA